MLRLSREAPALPSITNLSRSAGWPLIVTLMPPKLMVSPALNGTVSGVASGSATVPPG